VKRGLELLPDPVAKISPSKQRLVQRAVSKARDRALQPFTQGGRLEGDEGSLNRLSEKMYLRTLMEQHDAGVKHLELHQPVCVGYQYGNGVVFGTYSSPMLLMHAQSAIGPTKYCQTVNMIVQFNSISLR
jgi:hypothetical protein